MKILTDFHHSSLLRSTISLFEDRLGHEVYRPIGLDWYEQGFWGINDLFDTAKQYLSFDQAYKPGDGTPALNKWMDRTESEEGVGHVLDPGGERAHKVCTLEYFKNNPFDVCIASIPKHIEMYKKLIKLYNPKAKLIVQMGNEWPMDYWYNNNVLASVKPRPVTSDINAMFYHQEFDLRVFWWDTVKPTKKIFSFINVLQSMERGYKDFLALERFLSDFEFKSYGGQCRDGNMTGERELAEKMRESQFVFHVKDHGDGFGHVIHNAYAMGRPVITRKSDYINRLAEDLLVEGTYIDVDLGYAEVVRQVRELTDSPEKLAIMGDEAAKQFRKVVNYEQEAEEIAVWLTKLR